jgi:hypothetical protein
MTVWNTLKKYASQIGFTYNELLKTYNEDKATYGGKVKTTWNYLNKS